MDMAMLTKYAIAGGILFAAYKYVGDARVKGMVLGVAGVMVARQLPYVQEVI